MSDNKRLWEAIRAAKDIDDWGERSFSWEKAYISSVFSQTAYKHIPEYELKNVDRANLIPCSSYRTAFQVGKIQDFQFSSNESDLPLLTFSGTLLVSVVLEVNQIVFISLRGTQQLYDWFVNLQISKVKSQLHMGCGGGGYWFHKGFYSAIVRELNKLSDTISERFGRQNNIYTTGHSLGGALAAILNAKVGAWRKHRCCGPSQSYGRFRHDVIGCYTFGMPRYGDLDTVVDLPGPYHVYNKEDIVPTVPPRFLGYEDCLDEFCISGSGEVLQNNRKGNTFIGFIYKLLTKQGIREHDIELYVDRTQALSEMRIV